jgi:hypothetical protein
MVQPDNPPVYGVIIPECDPVNNGSVPISAIPISRFDEATPTHSAQPYSAPLNSEAAAPTHQQGQNAYL